MCLDMNIQKSLFSISDCEIGLPAQEPPARGTDGDVLGSKSSACGMLRCGGLPNANSGHLVLRPSGRFLAELWLEINVTEHPFCCADQ